MSLSSEGQTSEKTQAEITSNEGFLMKLPLDILVEILSRLPAIDAIICKLVCKKWLNISSTPAFAKLHLSRSRPSLFAFEEKHCRIFKFDDENDPSIVYSDPVIEFGLSVFPEIFQNCHGSVEPISSVNGLVCFRERCGGACDGVFPSHDILYVCNPVTREYVILPTVEGFVRCPDIAMFGFGVSNISGQYKAVRICQSLVRDDTTTNLDGIKESECCVYTFGTGSWRSIDGVPITYDYIGNGLFLNGNLHWHIDDLEGSELISCFDLENESFQPFPSPFPIEQPREYFFSLGVFTDCLCLCDNTSEFDIVIWVMKEYGVKKSWTKNFVISKMPHLRFLSYDEVTALKILKDGGILFSARTKQFMFTYRNGSETLQRINKFFYRNAKAMLHVSSFLSLKAFEREEVRIF